MSSIERLREYKAQKGPHGESTIRDAMTALGGRTVIDL